MYTIAAVPIAIGIALWILPVRIDRAMWWAGRHLARRLTSAAHRATERP